MHKRLSSKNGITLVALVITIIILLILAGISIQAITNTGIFTSASQAKKETQRAQVVEWLNLKLMEEQMYNSTGTAEEIIEATRVASYGNAELAQMGKKVVVDENTSTIEDGEQVAVYFYVQIDEDVYKVEMAGVKFIGEAGKFPPVIKIESITKTTNSITIKIKVSRNEEGTLEIYKKSEDDEDYSLEKTATGEEATGIEYTISELEQNKNYSIKIVATAKNEQVKEYTKDITLGSVPDLKEGDITFTYTVEGEEIDKETWTNKNVTVTANTEITGYILQTSKDGKTWSNATSQTFTENGQLYAVLYDGTNYGRTVSGNVTNIDTTKPIVTEATVKTNSIEITATDEASGIVGYAVTTSSTEPSDSSYISVENTKSLSTIVTEKTQGTTYYVWAKDAVGNVSNCVEVNIPVLNFNIPVTSSTWDARHMACNYKDELIASGGVVTWYDSAVYIKSTSGWGASLAQAITRNKYNLDNYNKIIMKIDNVNITEKIGVGISQDGFECDKWGEPQLIKYEWFSSSQITQLVLDISDIKGEYYIEGFVGGNGAAMRIIDVILEK